MLKIEHASLSYQGRRDYNQDSVVAKQIGNATWVFAVADGMGGANGGGIASELAISALMDYLENCTIANGSGLKHCLGDAVNKAHEVLSLKMIEDPELKGMGTTMVCLLVHNNNYAWASIGDSRIYRIDENSVAQITEDHTYVQDYINKNGNSLPQNILDNYSHILTRCLDGKMEAPDIYPADKDYLTLEKGDSFLLCSDGLLTDKMNTNVNTFKNFVLGINDINKVAKTLVAYAYSKGSGDNISVVVVRSGDFEIKTLKTEDYLLPEDEGFKDKKNWYNKFFNKE